jgi:hypothetical protein
MQRRSVKGEKGQERERVISDLKRRKGLLKFYIIYNGYNLMFFNGLLNDNELYEI